MASTSERLLLLLREHPGSTSDELQPLAGVTLNSTRVTLRNLATVGLARFVSVRSGQSGRPSYHWLLTDRGKRIVAMILEEAERQS